MTPRVFERCEEWGSGLAGHYADGGSPQSRALSSHGAESNPELLRDAKVAECCLAMHFGFDPEKVIDWTVYRPDRGWDLLVDLTKVDAKQVGVNDRFLIWPVRKKNIFDSKDFHVLVAVRTKGRWGQCCGWIGKKQFRRRWQIADEVHLLTEGTPYIELDGLHRMGIFPGHSDDPREHYCWCGEWGSRGTPSGWFCARHC